MSLFDCTDRLTDRAASPHFRRITAFDAENGLAVAEDQAATQFTATQVPNALGRNLATMTEPALWADAVGAGAVDLRQEVGLLTRA